MSRGSIYFYENQFYLQMNEATDKRIPYVCITYNKLAQTIRGCDPERPYFFVQKTLKNGLTKDSFVYLARNSVNLLSVDDIRHTVMLEAGRLGTDMMDKIKICADEHGWIPKILFEYF